MPWSNQSGGGGPWGQRGGSGGGKSPWGSGGPQGNGTPPDLEDILRRSQDRLKDFHAGRLDGRQGSDRASPRRHRDLAPDRLLHRSAERGRHQHDFRQVHRHDRGGPSLQPALSDRPGDQAERHRAAAHRGRLSLVRQCAAALARRDRGEPDADRRREHRRYRFRRRLAGQRRPRPGFRVQSPEPGGHHQGRGRERHARGHRTAQHPGRADDRAGERRPGSPPDHAGNARRLRRRRSHQRGADAGGAAAGRCAAGLLRRERGAAGRRSRAERGRDLRQPGRPGSPRRGRADRPAGRGLSRAIGRRCDRSGGPLPAGLRGIPQGPGGQPRADFPRDDGARLRWGRQDHHRSEQPERRALSCLSTKCSVGLPRPEQRAQPGATR